MALIKALQLWIGIVLLLSMFTEKAGTVPARAERGMATFDRTFVPWLREGVNRQPYEHLFNDVNRLLAYVNKGRWITVFVFRSGLEQRALLNCVYSFLKFGKARNYIVATNEASLGTCRKLRLPCYNASDILDRQADASSANIRAGWDKVLLVQRMLQLGYGVQIGDLDVVYLRPIWTSYMILFNKYLVDAVFMKERLPHGTSAGAGSMLGRGAGSGPAAQAMPEAEQRRRSLAAVLPSSSPSSSSPSTSSSTSPSPLPPHDPTVVVGLPDARVNLLNTGVYAFRSSNQSLQLLSSWLQPSTQGAGDWATINSMAYRTFMPCYSYALCRAVRKAGWLPMFLHATQLPGSGGDCPSRLEVPCDTRRLYVHASCSIGQEEDAGLAAGVQLLQGYGLWLVDEEGMPLYNEEKEGGAHPFLPCLGPAWTGM